MLRSMLLVFAVLFCTVTAEYCQRYGFSCPRKNRGIFGNDDDDEIYCCKNKIDCCDNCWDAVDTSSCGDVKTFIDGAVRLGTAVIIGIVVAVVAVIAVVVALCVCCCCQCARQGRNQGHVYQPPPQGQQMAVITQQGQYPSAPPAGTYPPPGPGQYPPPAAGQYPPPAAGQYPPPAAYPPAPPPYSQEAPYPPKM